MTRQAGMQPGATSPKAGRFQAAKPLPDETAPARGPSWEIPRLRRLLERPPLPPVPLAVRVHVTDEFEFFANENGSLYHDPGLRSPSRFQIFERGSDARWDDHEEDP